MEKSEEEVKRYLNAERQVALLFRMRAERFIKLMDAHLAGEGRGVPEVLLEKERDLVGVAAVMWVALHPLEEDSDSEGQLEGALNMIEGKLVVFEGEEEYTRHIVDHQVFSAPSSLTAQDGGNQDPFEVLNKLGNIQFKVEKPNLTIIPRGKPDGEK